MEPSIVLVVAEDVLQYRHHLVDDLIRARSTYFAPRPLRSSVRIWLQSTTPSVFSHAPSNDTVNPASRALTPPPEMEQTIGARGASAIQFRPQHFPPRVKNVMTMSGNHDMVSTLKELRPVVARGENMTRSEKLDLRLTPEAKRALQSAAAASQRSVSEFVLESALQRAVETLPDRQRFGLSVDAWAAFQEALDAPASVKPRLTKLLGKKGPFDGASKK